MRLTLVLLLASIATTSLAQNKRVIDDYPLAISHLKAAKAEIKAVKEDTSTKIDNILKAAQIEIKAVTDEAAKNMADLEALIAKYEAALETNTPALGKKPQARLKSLEAEYAETEAAYDKKANDSSAHQAEGTINALLNELATSAEKVVDLTKAVSVSTEEVGIGTTSPGVKLEVNGDALGGGAFDGRSGIQFDLGEIEFLSVTETACETVNFDTSFSKVPKVLATINHRSGLGGVHDPMTVWIEEITTTACQICVSDVKSYVDYRSSYDSVYVDWLAIGN